MDDRERPAVHRCGWVGELVRGREGEDTVRGVGEEHTCRMTEMMPSWCSPASCEPGPGLSQMDLRKWRRTTGGTDKGEPDEGPTEEGQTKDSQTNGRRKDSHRNGRRKDSTRRPPPPRAHLRAGLGVEPAVHDRPRPVLLA